MSRRSGENEHEYDDPDDPEGLLGGFVYKEGDDLTFNDDDMDDDINATNGRGRVRSSTFHEVSDIEEEKSKAERYQDMKPGAPLNKNTKRIVEDVADTGNAPPNGTGTIRHHSQRDIVGNGPFDEQDPEYQRDIEELAEKEKRKIEERKSTPFPAKETEKEQTKEITDSKTKKQTPTTSSSSPSIRNARKTNSRESPRDIAKDKTVGKEKESAEKKKSKPISGFLRRSGSAFGQWISTKPKSTKGKKSGSEEKSNKNNKKTGSKRKHDREKSGGDDDSFSDDEPRNFENGDLDFEQDSTASNEDKGRSDLEKTNKVEDEDEHALMDLPHNVETVVKLLLLGDSDVGKTSLMHRFTGGKFRANTMPTTGIDYSNRFIKTRGTNVKCQIWDTAGQERFHVISRNYYRGTHGIALVFDVTERETLEHVGYWMENIRQHAAADVFVVLIGNKIDDKNRKISSEEGKKVADSYEILYFETSAKEGTNVPNVFQTITEHIIKDLEEKHMKESSISGTPKANNDQAGSSSVQSEKKQEGSNSQGFGVVTEDVKGDDDDDKSDSDLDSTDANNIVNRNNPSRRNNDDKKSRIKKYCIIS